MKDDHKTKKRLVFELTELRSQNAALEKSKTGIILVELAAEEARRYAESIVETIREPLLVLDADMKILSANRNFYRTFKVNPTETIGTFIYDLGNKQWDIPKLRELLEEVLPGKEAFDDFEVAHHFQDIGHKIMLLNARQIYRKDIGTKMILLAVEDITERSRLEGLLIDAELMYRRLFETASDGIVLLEKREGKITHANPAAEKLLGYTEKESLGNKLQDIGVSLDLDDFQTTMQNLNKTGIINYRNVKVETRSGQHIDTEIYLVDRAKLVQCNIRDITERKLAKVHLETEKRRYSELFQNITIGVCRTTPGEKGTFVDVNPAMVKMFEADDREQLLALHPSELYLDTAQRLIISDMIVSQGVIKGKDIRFKTLKGRPIWCLITSSKKVDTDGQVYFDNTIEDITTRKLMEEEIRILNVKLEQRVMDRTAQLEAANKELETFSYSVSHDLRAPLRSIDGFSQALLEDYGNKLDDTGKTYLERVRKATQHMGMLIDDMLKLSRITKSQFHTEYIDLSRMVRAIAEEQKKSYPDRIVTVIVREGVVVQGDPHLMQIALVNLMDNAWKFTSNAWHPRIEFGRTVKNGEVVYFIRDNGVGFDMAYVGKLFGAFQRLHTTHEFPGSGIGLATVQRVIHRHGGRVWAEGEVGKGATFYFTLPL